MSIPVDLRPVSGRRRPCPIVCVLAAVLVLPPAVRAGQQPAPEPQAAAAPDAAPAQGPDDDPDPDRDPNLSQPDFTLVNMPTTLRLPRYGSAFRVTHRFTRPLGDGSFGDLAEDLFGLDSGALIGLEYRFGLMRGLQVGVLRTSDRTIQIFGQYAWLRQDEGWPVGLSVVASIDGTDNFRDHYSPAAGVAISRELGTYGALYVQPIWVIDADPLAPSDDAAQTLLVGLGARLRIRPTVYVVGEYVPRAGDAPGGPNQGAVGIEKRAGGHVFQLAVSNGFSNTAGQLARGGAATRGWFLGFNISRKLFR